MNRSDLIGRIFPSIRSVTSSARRLVTGWPDGVTSTKSTDPTWIGLSWPPCVSNAAGRPAARDTTQTALMSGLMSQILHPDRLADRMISRNGGVETQNQ